MLDSEEARWIRSTANELNNLLQVIAESSMALEGHCKTQPGVERYLTMLHSGMERATKVTRQLAERVGGYPTDDIPVAVEAVPESPRIFPLEKMPPREPEAAARTPITIHNPTGTRELVMIVDDEDFITQLGAIVLAEEGYRVITAKDGMQALEIYRELKEAIDLVILDFSMPQMDGSDVFDELQAINPKASVILSSGFAEQGRLRTMLERGLRGFIPKPYTQKKLLTQIRQTLDAGL